MKTLTTLIFTGLVTLAGCSPGQPTRTAADSSPFDPSLEEFVRNFQSGGEGAEGAGGAAALDPEESLGHFQLVEGLEMDLVAHEPRIRQPLNLHFDERGRLWVVQYLQYPYPAGIQVVKYDRYLRAQFNEVPPPPPHHYPGADKITILEDTNGDGIFDSSKDFVTGLSITSSVAVGTGGVWVLMPPYLLFYPDRNRDDIPDGDPEVHLSGFGLEDTHSVANSLHWGPDGWLYGATGSTSTHTVEGIHFLGQAIWRYQPETRRFELFAEGGGNTWSLDFDSQGRAFSGTNHGSTRGVHYVQGGYYIKGFSKHGPLTHPFAFGYFQHMKHVGYEPRFPQTFVIYEGGRLPAYESQVVVGMSLTNRVQASRLLRDTSSFRTEDTDAVVLTDNRWFRPVDIKDSPDGAIYIADWHDIRLSHLNPRDTWDRSHGRIYRLRSSDWRPIPPFDLHRQSAAELIALLSHPNKWFREQARRVLGERRDPAVVSRMKELLAAESGQAALEALWVVNLSGAWDEEFAYQQLAHPNPMVRAWTVRLLGDEGRISERVRRRLVEMARNEPDVEVRSQLASSVRRLSGEDALPVIRELIGRSEDADDIHLPLLIWWALEKQVSSDRERLMTMLEDKSLWAEPIFRRHLASRLAQRFSFERGDQPFYTFSDDYLGIYSGWQSNYTPEVADANLAACLRLLELAPDGADVQEIIWGMEEGLQEATLDRVPAALQARLAELAESRPDDPVLLSLQLRLGRHDGVDRGLQMLRSASTSPEARLRLVHALADRQLEAAAPALLELLRRPGRDDLRLQLIRVMGRFSGPEIPAALLEIYPHLQASARAAVREVLSGKPGWARSLLEAARGGSLPVEEISDVNLQAMQELKDPTVDDLVRQFRVRLESNLPERADRLVLDQGQRMYNRLCGACHLETGRGMKAALGGSEWVLGPDEPLIRIVLNGKKGQEIDMPPLGGQLNNQEIAAVLSFIRRQWGNQGPLVNPQTVERIRGSVGGRTAVWTEEELQAARSGNGR